MKQKSFVLFFIFWCFLIIDYSCTCDRQKPKNAVTIQGKQIQVKIHIDRMEKDLFTTNLDSIPDRIPYLKAKYGEFFDIFNYKILKLGSSDDAHYPELLKGFLTDFYQNASYHRIMQIYPNLDQLTADLTTAFTYFKAAFPEQKIPRIFSCISGWNLSIATSDTIMGICLDMYLGRNCEYYEKLRLDKYMRYTLQKEYIVPDCMRAWGHTTFEFKDSSENLLRKMLYEGKIQFFVKTMLPETNDTLIFGYTPAQMKWCHKNEDQMWTYLVEHKLLFSTNYMIIMKLLNPAPFTSYFTTESPGKACIWLGYRIIDAYMKNNQDVSLNQLMVDDDYQTILRKSKYKP